MEILRRILKVIVFALSIPFIVASYYLLSVTILFFIIKYLFTGEGDIDLLFYPITKTIELASGVIEKI